MNADSRVGTVLAGHRIERTLGDGGMGVVYLARNIRLDRLVALKVIKPHLSHDVAYRQRFERESRIAASIDHPHVISVHDAGETEDGVLFLSMRYVDGCDLRLLLSERGPLKPDAATELITQIADALDAAHERGLIHRDVKPANIIIASRGGRMHAYLTDFGVAKRAATLSKRLTDTGQWVGTLDYVAPEQIQGPTVDGRADIYALACVLYETLTGQVPFPRAEELGKLLAHATASPPGIGAAAPAVAANQPQVVAALDAVVARGMAKNPDDRYASAGDLARAAVCAACGQAPTAPVRPAATGPAAPHLPSEEPDLTAQVVVSPPRQEPDTGSPLPEEPAEVVVSLSAGASADARPVSGGPKPAPASPARARRPRVHPSRRGILGAAGGGALAALAAGAIVLFDGDGDSGSGGSDDIAGDLQILNEALTLEHFEADFYAKIVDDSIIQDPIVRDLIKTFGETQQEHVDALKAEIKKLGGTAVKAPATNLEPTFDGGLKKILEAAADFENLGAAGYLGEVVNINNQEVLALALAMHSVEARHAAALNTILGRGFGSKGGLKGSFPDGAFARPISMKNVLTAVKPFLG